MLPSIFGENLFDDFFGDPFGMMPRGRDPLYGKHAKNLMRTDVRETEDTYELDVDLPGFKKDEVTLELKDGVLTITVDADFAVLTGKLSGIGTLKAQGVEKIVFVTKDATSAFRLADLLEKGAAAETYKLTHDGKTAAFTAGGQQTDISGILVEA